MRKDWAILLENWRELLVMQCATPRGGRNMHLCGRKKPMSTQGWAISTKSHHHGQLGKHDAIFGQIQWCCIKGISGSISLLGEVSCRHDEAGSWHKARLRLLEYCSIIIIISLMVSWWWCSIIIIIRWLNDVVVMMHLCDVDRIQSWIISVIFQNVMIELNVYGCVGSF